MEFPETSATFWGENSCEVATILTQMNRVYLLYESFHFFLMLLLGLVQDLPLSTKGQPVEVSSPSNQPQQTRDFRFKPTWMLDGALKKTETLLK